MEQLEHTSLTCVHYVRGDALGKLLAHVALAPVLLLLWQAARVYSRRELHEAGLLLGLLAEEVLARGLKHVLRHPRPPSCAALQLCHSHGMPSSHTSMAFAFLALSSADAARLWAARGPASRALSLLEQAATAALAAGVAASRVYLGYHSADQVAAGAALGLAFGVAWAGVLHALRPAYGRLAALPLARQLGVKDTYACAEPLLLEAEAHRQQRPPGAGAHAKVT